MLLLLLLLGECSNTSTCQNGKFHSLLIFYYSSLGARVRVLLRVLLRLRGRGGRLRPRPQPPRPQVHRRLRPQPHPEQGAHPAQRQDGVPRRRGLPAPALLQEVRHLLQEGRQTGQEKRLENTYYYSFFWQVLSLSSSFFLFEAAVSGFVETYLLSFFGKCIKIVMFFPGHHWLGVRVSLLPRVRPGGRQVQLGHGRGVRQVKQRSWGEEVPMQDSVNSVRG